MMVGLWLLRVCCCCTVFSGFHLQMELERLLGLGQRLTKSRIIVPLADGPSCLLMLGLGRVEALSRIRTYPSLVLATGAAAAARQGNSLDLTNLDH